MPNVDGITDAKPKFSDLSLDVDPRIDLTKPIWNQAQHLRAADDAEECAEIIVQTLKSQFTKDDDAGLWACVLRAVLSDINIRDGEGDVPPKRFIKIGCCSHWFRPHQSRWTVAGGFAWPSGWHGISGFSAHGLPELDWALLFEGIDGSWMPVKKFSGKERLEVRVSIPARSARHPQAAIHTLWSPMNHRVFYGFRRKEAEWKLAARSDFYSDNA